MRCNYPPDLFVVQYFQNSLRHRTAKLRVRSCTKFINQHQRFRRGVRNKIPHLRQVSAIGTQITFNRLIIAYICKNLIKNPNLTRFMNRDQQSALQHDLQQANCFHTNRFSSGIRS